jgi:hypothetical protein
MDALSSTLKLIGPVSIGGFGLAGRLAGGLAQYPRDGSGIPALRQAFDRPTSDTPIAWASFNTGVSHTLSNSSRVVKLTGL